MTHEERKNLVARHQRLYLKHQAALNELFAECTHEELEKKSMYFSGSYYDKESTNYWDECKLCGKRFNQISKTGYSYG